jgi:hypothetical protein
MMETTYPYPRGASPEEIWAILREVATQQKETDRIVQEVAAQQKETAAQMKETDRRMKKTDEQMGKLSNRFGELAEHLVAPGIHERFNEQGYHFESVAPGGVSLRDKRGNVQAEIDLLMENHETIMAVEVKSKPVLKDVEHHCKRLEILRKHRDTVGDLRKIQGAIAGALFGVAEKQAALDAGFYVIVQSGDTMKLDIPEGFVPREW